jgi:hypothetical protein
MYNVSYGFTKFDHHKLDFGLGLANMGQRGRLGTPTIVSNDGGDNTKVVDLFVVTNFDNKFFSLSGLQQNICPWNVYFF